MLELIPNLAKAPANRDESAASLPAPLCPPGEDSSPIGTLPEQDRQLAIAPGTHVCRVGDHLEPSPDMPRVVMRRLIVADAGRDWIDRLFRAVRGQLNESDPNYDNRVESWLQYKERSVALSPDSWVAFYHNGIPVGLAQGGSTARVYYVHFFYLHPDFQHSAAIAAALQQIEGLARRRRCHTITFEGARTSAVLCTLGPDHITDSGFIWHQRVQLSLSLAQRHHPPSSTPQDGWKIVPLELSTETVATLMRLEGEAFLQAECDHPGELPMDFTDGYRTTLIPMQPASAMLLHPDGGVRGALYAEAQGTTAWIHTLFVEPASQNRGLARRLLDHCLERHHELGFSSTELMVLAENHPAMCLYRSAGFHEVRRVDLFIKRL